MAGMPTSTRIFKIFKLNLAFCPDLLECLNGEHKGDVQPTTALKNIFEELHSHCQSNWAVTTKSLIVLHRGL